MQAGGEEAVRDASARRTSARPLPHHQMPPGGAVSRGQRGASPGGAPAWSPAGEAVLAGGISGVTARSEALDNTVVAASDRAGGAGRMRGEER